MKLHIKTLEDYLLPLTAVKYFPRHNILSLFMINNAKLSDIEKIIQLFVLDRPRFIARHA